MPHTAFLRVDPLEIGKNTTYPRKPGRDNPLSKRPFHLENDKQFTMTDNGRSLSKHTAFVWRWAITGPNFSRFSSHFPTPCPL